MIKPYQLVLVIVTSMIPILFAITFYNVIDCNHLNTKNYSAWLEQGNKGSVDDMVNGCNHIHSMIWVMLVPASPVLGYFSYRTFKQANDISTKSQEGSRDE